METGLLLPSLYVRPIGSASIVTSWTPTGVSQAPRGTFWHLKGFQGRCPTKLNPSSGRANRIPWDQPGTEKALTSHFTQSTRRKWSSVCLTSRGNVNRFVSGFPSKLTWSGTATCQRSVRDTCTDTGSMVLMRRRKAIVLITTNFFLTPTATKFRGLSVGATPTLDTGSDTKTN